MTLRVSAGLPGLDAVLDGGFLPDRTVLVTGPPGSGKTTLLLHSLAVGARAGEGAVMLCVDQRPHRVLEDAERLGFQLQDAVESGRLALIDGARYLSRERLAAADVLADVTRRAHEALAVRIVIDSLSSLTPWTDDSAAGSRFLRTLLDGLEELDCVSLLSWCSASLDAGRACAEVLASGIVDLGVEERSDGWRRSLCVRKMRGTDVQPLRHPFEIGPGGIGPAVPRPGSGPRSPAHPWAP
jgi:KaiC/GvpD/RAD55 family RecA-like ATPase